MQSLSPLTIADLLKKGTEPLLKIELFSGKFSPFAGWDTYGSKKYGEGIYGGGWWDIADLPGIDGDCLVSLSLSISTGVASPRPVAATWEATVFNKDALFFPEHPTSDLRVVFTMGRIVKLYVGIKVSDVDYFWLQMIGVMSKPNFEGRLLEVNISGFDYTQVLTDTKLKSPDNFWGSNVTESTVADQYEYTMPAACKGIYIAYWDGTAIYNGNDWTYDSVNNKFVFNSDKTIIDGVDNLLIYYFTQQIPENIIADLLVTAGLYGNQASALLAMEYTATGLTIDRVWFNAGNSALHAIKLICERCNYRFYFKYEGIPVFKPKPSAKVAGSEDLQLTHNQIADYKYYEEDEELFNRIVIEGEEQASPIWKQDAEPNRLRGSASDSDSIEAIGEKTWPIINHLFQDQTTIDNMCATLLAEFMVQKKYMSFNLEFSPIPIEIWDTIRIQTRLTPPSGKGKRYGTFKYGDGTKYGNNGIVIVQRGLDRDIKIDRFSNKMILEEVT